MWSRFSCRISEIQIVHRLDMSTSGLMLLAKHKQAEAPSEEAVSISTDTQTLLCAVWGSVGEAEGLIDLPLIVIGQIVLGRKFVLMMESHHRLDMWWSNKVSKRHY